MARTVKVSDLTQTEGDPGTRAVVRTQREPLESCKFHLKMPGWLGGAIITIDTKTRDGSWLAKAITIFLITVAGCLAAGVVIGAYTAGVPVWLIGVAIGMVLAPAGIYILISRAASHSQQ